MITITLESGTYQFTFGEATVKDGIAISKAQRLRASKSDEIEAEDLLAYYNYPILRYTLAKLEKLVDGGYLELDIDTFFTEDFYLNLPQKAVSSLLEVTLIINPQYAAMQIDELKKIVGNLSVNSLSTKDRKEEKK